MPLPSRRLALETLEDRLTPVTFGPGTSYTAGINGQTVATGDLDGDANVDVVYGAASGGMFSFLNDGAGNLTQTDISPITDSRTAVLADLNGDARLDLIAANGTGQQVAVALGRGDGTFQLPISYAVGGPALDLALADFDGDGRTDVAVANNGVAFLRGLGNGAFAPVVQLATGAGNESLAVGDFNGDGRTDITTGVFPDNRVSVIINDGGGTFAPPVLYDLSSHGGPIATGDLDGNGRPDIVVSYGNTGMFAVLLTNLDGTLRPRTEYAFPGTPSAFAVVDFDLDGRLDVAIADFNASDALVYTGLGDGTLVNPVLVETGMNTTDITTGDLNNDGRPDLISANATNPGSLTVALNTTDVSVISFVVSAPAGAELGRPFAVTVATRNVSGNTLQNYTGTVTFTSTDGAAVLPPDVTFTPGDRGVVTVMVTMNTLGPQTVTATDTGNGATGVSGTITVTAVMATPALSSSANPSQLNDPVTFTFTLTPPFGSDPRPTGMVQFFDNGNPLGAPVMLGAGSGSTATAFITAGAGGVPFLTAGSHTITAEYTGVAPYQSASAAVTQQVNAPAASAALASNNNPALVNDPITFTFTLTPAVPSNPRPTGTVQFFDNGAPLGAPVALTGGTTDIATATITAGAGGVPLLAAGSHTITAEYTPDVASPYLAAAATLAPDQSVTAASTTLLTALSGPSNFGSPVGFIATVAPVSGLPNPTGRVDFFNITPQGAVLLGSANLDSTGRAAFNTAAIRSGTNTIRADYLGDGFYRPSSATAVQVVDRKTFVVVGADAGPTATVRVYDSLTGAKVNELNPFDGGYRGGVKVGSGDVNNDGTADVIVSAGAGAPGGHVRVFSGVDGSLLASFLTFPGYTPGVNISAGDVDGDGFSDVVVGTSIVNDHVKVYSGRTLVDGGGGASDGTFERAVLQSFFAYGGGNPTGVTVGAGDIDGDGRADVITGTATLATHVKAFSGATGAVLASFFAFESGFVGGVNVAGGDTNNDGFADLIVGKATTETRVKVVDGRTRGETANFLAFPGANVGVRVASADRVGDRAAEILAGAAGIAPLVSTFTGAGGFVDTIIANSATEPPSPAGIFVGGSPSK